MKTQDLTKLLDSGFCPLVDKKLLPLAMSDTLTNNIESDEGDYFYYTYKQSEVTRFHPLGGETSLVLTVWGNA